MVKTSPKNLPASSNLTAKDLGQTLSGIFVVGADDNFFPLTEKGFLLNPALWNQLLPYRLIMLQAVPGKNKKNATTYQIPGNKNLPIFTLPIAPQNISIQMPFASQTTVLSDGILVENNGSPLRMITISGTTGVLPYRPTGAPSVGDFPGSTARNISNVVDSGKAVGAALNNPYNPNKPLDPWIENSGYAQFHKLSEFLQLYSQMAKNPENSDLRLALDIAKDNTTYLITPKMFTLGRSADSPLEYKYTLQVEAWKRILINGYQKESVGEGIGKGVLSSLQKVQKVINVLNSVSKIINSSINLIQSVRADVARLVNSIREIILIAKNVAGIIVSIIDLPRQLLNSFKGPILGAINEVKAAWAEIPEASKRLAGANNAVTDDVVNTNKTSDKNNVSGKFATNQSSSTKAGVTKTGNPNPGNPGPFGGATAPQSNRASILDSLLKDPILGAPFLGAINLDQLDIPSNLQEQIDAEISRVSRFTRQDFQNTRNYVSQISRDLSVAFGVGDSLYDQVHGYVSVTYPPATRKPSRSELDVLFALRKFTTVLNDLSTFEISGDNSINETFNFIGNLAASADINLNRSQGKRALPVIYGATIQEIANTYTGSTDNTAEIILLNGLIAPYIDEEGIFDDLISNGNSNTINIANGSTLFIGQKLILTSSTVPPFSRAIVEIKLLTPTNYMITLDGNPDLDRLTTAQLAKVQFFQRGTVSSRDSIFIPAALPPSDIPARLRPLPYYFKDVDNLAQFTGVDIAIGSDNDIIMSTNGQVALAGGLANLQQALKIKFITPQGSLFRHPNFGFGVVPGTSVRDISISDIASGVSQLIGSDERFSEVVGLDIQIAGPTLSIEGGVIVSRTNSILPFNLIVRP